MSESQNVDMNALEQQRRSQQIRPGGQRCYAPRDNQQLDRTKKKFGGCKEELERIRRVMIFVQRRDTVRPKGKKKVHQLLGGTVLECAVPDIKWTARIGK